MPTTATYNETHLTRLADLKALAQRTKKGLDDQNARITTLETNTKKVADLKALAYKDKVEETDLDTALGAKVAKIEGIDTTVTTLNGDAKTEGSVKKQVADAVAGIVAGADASYDTLKEIADWITSHAQSASQMNSQIGDNKKGLDDLKKTVEAIPGSVDTKIAALKIEDYAKKTDVTTEITTAVSTEAAKHYTKDEAKAELAKKVNTADLATDAEVTAMLDEVFAAAQA